LIKFNEEGELSQRKAQEERKKEGKIRLQRRIDNTIRKALANKISKDTNSGEQREIRAVNDK
jgi:hypothetical protein